MTLKLLRSNALTLPPSLCRVFPITAIMGLATVLFTYRIESEGLWLDELTSLVDANQSIPAAYFENQLRPLYYFLLMGWMRLGSSDGWLRGLAVLFALIGVFLLYRLGRRLVGEAEGLIAALMLTLSPVFINHAQEVRMYTLSLCLGVAGTLCLANALLTKAPRRPSERTLAGWALLRLLAIYAVPLNLTLLLPDVVLIWLRFRRERPVLLSAAKWLVLLFVLWSPSVLSVVEESSPSGSFASHHLNWVPPGPAELMRTLKFLTVWPFAQQSGAIAANFYKLFTLMAAGLLGASLFRNRRPSAKTSANQFSSQPFSQTPSQTLSHADDRRPHHLLWAAAWFFLPLLPIFVFAHLAIPIWQIRYLLFVSPYLLLLLAGGLTRLWRQWRIAAVVIGAVYLMAAGGGLVHYYSVQDRPDYKFNIATLEQYEQPGDAIVWAYHYLKPLDHYYKGNQDHIYWRTIRDIKTPADVQAWMDQFPKDYERLWLVSPQPGRIAGAIDKAAAENFEVEQTFDYEQGSKIFLLLPREVPPMQATQGPASQGSAAQAPSAAN